MGAERMDTKSRAFRYVVGIDEAGRGPLAGPVALGGILVSTSFDPQIFGGVRDSKQHSPEEREAWNRNIRFFEAEGILRSASTLVGAKRIDSEGITGAISAGIQIVLQKLKAPPRETLVLLDGSLYAPAEFLFQETLIKGDESEPLISLASIVAKVRRDRVMVTLSRHYPEYGFEIHKGYGTPLHYKRIEKYGLSSLHRKSYCTSFT